MNVFLFQGETARYKKGERQESASQSWVHAAVNDHADRCKDHRSTFKHIAVLYVYIYIYDHNTSYRVGKSGNVNRASVNITIFTCCVYF